MNLLEAENLEEQRRRRRRVHRIRTMLIAGGCILFLLLVACCIFLLVKTISLERQVEALTEQVEELAYGNNQANGIQNEEALSSSSEDAQAESVFGLQDQFSEQETTTASSSNEREKVYLTFDDGPSDYTEEILDTLDEYGVKATFFVIGKTDEASLAMYKEIVDRGHTLAMHSYSHKYQTLYSSVEAFEEDLKKEMDLLTEATGVTPWLYRFPGGSSNTVGNTDIQSLIDVLDKYNISYCDWNVSTGDATNGTFNEQKLLANVDKDLEKYDQAIILMHDTNSKEVTRDSLGTLLEDLQSRDCYILPITQNSILVQHVTAQ